MPPARRAVASVRDGPWRQAWCCGGSARSACPGARRVAASAKVWVDRLRSTSTLLRRRAQCCRGRCVRAALDARLRRVLRSSWVPTEYTRRYFATALLALKAVHRVESSACPKHSLPREGGSPSRPACGRLSTWMSATAWNSCRSSRGCSKSRPSAVQLAERATSRSKTHPSVDRTEVVSSRRT